MTRELNRQDALDERLREMRASFDDAFAHQPVTSNSETLDVLEVAVASEAFLVRVSDLRSVHASCVVKRVPTPSATLLGLWSHRGAVYAVHDTAALLGVGRDAAATWLMVAREAPIAFAATGLRRYHRLDADAWVEGASKGDGMQAARADGVRLTVISMPRLIGQVTQPGDAGGWEEGGKGNGK